MLVAAISPAVGAATIVKRNALRGDVPLPTAATTEDASISQHGRVLSEAGGGDDSLASAVMSRYDLRNISYSDLVTMAGELRDVGALKKEDYLDFIGPSPEYGSLTGERVADWNASKDYVAMREQQVAFLRRSGAESRFIDFANYHLSLFRHFESMHSR